MVGVPLLQLSLDLLIFVHLWTYECLFHFVPSVPLTVLEQSVTKPGPAF